MGQRQALDGWRVPRDEAASVLSLRRDLVGLLADGFGAGAELTGVEVLTLLALAPVDWLPLEHHVDAHRLVRAWWAAAPADPRAVLVVHRAGAAVLAPHPAEVLAADHDPVHAVPLGPLAGFLARALAHGS
ncbi:hypothetical protein GTR02_09120 [Kineococcus sp. R8]|uniref:hypothetical protein n=1 Tax=Kineococcus siccus TaxID=2696567 RepID=UPI0014122EE5|nr:hypothetical protein [Kineococcus siccus]NAZ81979.1 hypothetical protein [Kineococcus siccus]